MYIVILYLCKEGLKFLVLGEIASCSVFWFVVLTSWLIYGRFKQNQLITYLQTENHRLLTQENEVKQSVALNNTKKTKFPYFPNLSAASQKGVISHLSYVTKTYVNPHSNGTVIVSRSTDGAGTLEDYVAITQKNTHTCDGGPHESFTFDIGENRTVLVDHYTCRHNATHTTGYFARKWEFQASNDINADFDVLCVHSKEMRFNAQTMSLVFEVEQQNNKPYRYFRILQNGPNSSSNFHLMISGMELLGLLTETKQPPGAIKDALPL